jgi:hypothetical protein
LLHSGNQLGSATGAADVELATGAARQKRCGGGDEGEVSHRVLL